MNLNVSYRSEFDTLHASQSFEYSRKGLHAYVSVCIYLREPLYTHVSIYIHPEYSRKGLHAYMSVYILMYTSHCMHTLADTCEHGNRVVEANCCAP